MPSPTSAVRRTSFTRVETVDFDGSWKAGDCRSPRWPTRPPYSRHAASNPVLGRQPDTFKSQATVINMAVFQQILELDDDETHEYSRELVIAYFSQARSTFKEMDKALAKKDLSQLSSLGHFLKGSSAALGVSKVSSTCQKIEHHGKLRDEKNNRDLSKDEALSKIGALLRSVGSECSLAEQWLTRWYEDQTA